MPERGGSTQDVLEKLLGQISLPPGRNPQSIHRELMVYEQIVVKWNSKFNLISNNDLYIIHTRHLLDSLQPLLLCRELTCLKFGAKAEAVDVGSGAGFPSLPLSILLDQMQFTLVESNKKKATFLSQAARELSLVNVNVSSERAERLGHDADYRGRFDCSFSRALAKPVTAIELVLPFLKVGGRAFFWASGDEWRDRDKVERAADLLGGGIESVRRYDLPGEAGIERSILILEKIRETNSNLPRREGLPKKRPLA